jgi:hypothetical protein
MLFHSHNFYILLLALPSTPQSGFFQGLAYQGHPLKENEKEKIFRQNT